MNQTVSCRLFLLLLSIVASPAMARQNIHPLSFAEGTQETPDEARAVLYKRFTDNFRTNQQVAYEAAKEYLQKYADRPSDITQYLRKWVSLYEQSVQSPSVKPQTQTIGFVFKREPELGQALPGNPPHAFSPIVTDAAMPDPNKPGGWLGSGQPMSGFHAEWLGIKGVIGADLGEWVISYVGTSDPVFRTPEGLKVGDSAARVLELSRGKVVKENDYVFDVKLSSGWYARLLQADYDSQGKLIPNTGGELRPGTKVTKFYKKSNAQSAEKESIRGTVIAESTSVGVRGNTTQRLFVVRTQKQAGQNKVDEFVIVINKYKTKPDTSPSAQPGSGVRMIEEPHLTKTVTAQKQPLEFLLTRDESCDGTMESISYSYIGVTLPNGKRGRERMRDLSNISEEDVSKLSMDTRLPCYVLRADEFKLLRK